MISILKNEEISMLKDLIENSYAPYTNFNVAAILKSKDDKIYKGVNVENAGIQSICAERSAFASAISDGAREFSYILIGGKKEGRRMLQKIVPCGYCLQFMSEFVDEDFRIFVAEENYIKEYSLSELLPNGFNLKKEL